MNRNLGNFDQLTRIFVGIDMIAGVFTGPMTVWGRLGVVPPQTALVGWCPIYGLSGVSSFSEELPFAGGKRRRADAGAIIHRVSQLPLPPVDSAMGRVYAKRVPT